MFHALYVPSLDLSAGVCAKPPSFAKPPIPVIPVPETTYTYTFVDLEAAVEADDYLTFGLVDTVVGTPYSTLFLSPCSSNAFHQ